MTEREWLEGLAERWRAVEELDTEYHKTPFRWSYRLKIAWSALRGSWLYVDPYFMPRNDG